MRIRVTLSNKVSIFSKIRIGDNRVLVSYGFGKGYMSVGIEFLSSSLSLPTSHAIFHVFPSK